MHIKGWRKLTLLDFPGKLACTVFFGGCGLRCPFCHNSSLVLTPRELPDLPEEEFFAFLARRRGVLEGVAVTGGEPLLQPGIDGFLGRIREMGYLVKLDTNGEHPDALRRVLRASLVDYVAMDIKNSPDRYGPTVGLADPPMDAFRESVRLIMGQAPDYEFRTTLVRSFHDRESMRGIGEWIAGARRYFLQGFVDSGALIREGLTGLDRAEAEELLAAVRTWVPTAELRGYD